MDGNKDRKKERWIERRVNGMIQMIKFIDIYRQRYRNIEIYIDQWIGR